MESVIHCVQQCMVRHKDDMTRIVLTIDFKNAFNSMNRETFINAVATEAPEISRWIRWCYLPISRLLFGNHVVNSSSGVQQGDALGPALFSLGLHPMLKAIKDLTGIDIITAYLDDVVVAGDAQAVLNALLVIQRMCPGLGLELNLTKCRLIPTGTHVPDSMFAQFPPNIPRN